MGRDTFGRTIDYLRISVTDRCNYRCVYCMPPTGIEQKTHHDILSFEEIERFVRQAARQGIRRIRLTGGEPLVRRGVPELVGRLNSIEGIEEISLTTNGSLLPKYAEELWGNGLARVNISLDTLDEHQYETITRVGRLKDALAGIDSALKVGFDPVKLNVVVVRSLKQDLFRFACMTIDRPLHVRFIEYMPIGTSTGALGQGWTDAEVVESAEVINSISGLGLQSGIGPLRKLHVKNSPVGAGPARYYCFDNAQGTVGVISPLSNHFCTSCNRLRLTADGMLRPCLFSDYELNARRALRSGVGGDPGEVITRAIAQKPKGNSFGSTVRHMSHIGG